jgi:hypothetical protein
VEDECDDPDHTVYYLGRHPSKQTHRLLAQYAHRVLTKCTQHKPCVPFPLSIFSSHSYPMPETIIVLDADSTTRFGGTATT